jgi:hypothetical protein
MVLREESYGELVSQRYPDFEWLYPLSPRLIDKNQVGRAPNAPV